MQTETPAWSVAALHLRQYHSNRMQIRMSLMSSWSRTSSYRFISLYALHSPRIICLSCQTSFQNLLSRPHFMRMDWVTFQACLEDYTVQSLSYVAWSSLGHTKANHNSGVGIAISQSLQLQLGSGTKRLRRRNCVVTFYRLTIASLAWTTSLGCKIYFATLVSLALYRVTQKKSAEKHTNSVDPPHTSDFVAQRTSDWFSPKLHETRGTVYLPGNPVVNDEEAINRSAEEYPAHSKRS
jgi:hypothetical protein